jgi:CRP-like cAMP-binding protein
MIEVTTAALAAHPFLRGMQPGQMKALGAAASHVIFEPGQRIFEAGGYAGRFWLIQAGHIALDLRVQGEAVIVETVGIGELLGWSWLFPPFTWTSGAVALSPVQAFEFDAAAVRACCVADPALDGEVTLRVARVMARRLTAARTRLLAVSSPQWV